MPVVLYGCESWSLTPGEKRRLRVYENRALRRIFGPKKYEVRLEWRQLHNEGLNDVYTSPNIIRVIKSRRMRWTGNVARTGERPVAYTILGRWEENIEMDLEEVGCSEWNGFMWLRIGTGGGHL